MDAVTQLRTFEQFFRDEYAAIVALASWLTGDRSSGEDLAQEAMGAAHRRWSEVGGYDRPGTFVRRVAINLASNERRRRGRERRAVDRLGPSRDASARDGADPASLRPDDALWSAVARLPLHQRAAIGLRYLEDRTTGEIASALECSEATVRVHLHRAHRRLAEQLGCTTEEELS